MMTTTTQLPEKGNWIRRFEALQILGITDEAFTKLCHAEVVTPKYFVWQVRDARGAIVFEAGESKAQAEARRIRGTATPQGRAWYSREEIEKLKPQAK